MGFTQQQIVDQVKKTGVVPLFTHDNKDDAMQVIEAAYRGGIRAFEFTNRRSNSFEVFQHLVTAKKKYSDLMLGIGTIMDAVTTQKFIDVGADFIISPILKLEMAPVCTKAGVPWMPGCATLTEIVTAKENGAEIIKVFPGSVLGPGFVSAIKPVIPDLKLMITGGVEPNEKNLTGWFKAGATCVGMGSQLFTKEILAEKNWALLEQRVKECIAIADQVRK